MAFELDGGKKQSEGVVAKKKPTPTAWPKTTSTGAIDVDAYPKSAIRYGGDAKWFHAYQYLTPAGRRELQRLQSSPGGKEWNWSQLLRAGGFLELPSDKLSPYDFDAKLSTAEQAQFNRYKDSMRGAYEEWWVLDKDERGNTLGQNIRRNGNMMLEQGMSEAGFSDRLQGALSTWYNNANFALTDIGDLNLIDPTDINIDDPGGGGGYGGGGGGGGGPTYLGPDRRVVEDSVKAMLMALTGQETDQRVQELADTFDGAHKEAWDVRMAGTGRDVDPNQRVMDTIRDQEDYKRVHTLRSEGQDEMRWISDRNQRLQQLGLTGADAEERAITMAQLGTNLNDIETGKFQNSKGRKDITLMSKLQQTAEKVARAL